MVVTGDGEDRADEPIATRGYAMHATPRRSCLADRGKIVVGTPAQSSTSGHHARLATDSAPVREAREASAAASPPRAWTIHSATLNARTACRVTGTLAISQRRFAIVGTGLI